MNTIARCLLAFSVATAFAAQASEPVTPKPTPPAAPSAPEVPPDAKPAYDAELAKRYGADERGMRRYVLVILKTGPTPVTDPDQRKAMFAGHFANIERLAREGKLVVAGPFGKNEDGWRGLYLFAVTDVEEARKLVATDPVVIHGEMVPEIYPWYGTAAMMAIPEVYPRLEPPKPATP
jgi:uncharacterized protein YciI